MHDALGDPLVIEVRDLLEQVEVLEQGRPARADLQRVLIVADRDALVGGQHRLPGPLMELTTASRHGVVGRARFDVLGLALGHRERDSKSCTSGRGVLVPVIARPCTRPVATPGAPPRTPGARAR